MLSSTILDVAIGLIFVFFVVRLTASAILEAIAGIINWRSGTLLKGIEDLLNDPQFTGLAAQLYQHALINPRNAGRIDAAIDPPGQVGPAPNPGNMIETTLRKGAPAYIDPKQFADALIDILNTGRPDATAPASEPDHPGKMASGNSASIASAIDYVVPPNANPQINGMLRGMARRTEGDLDQMRQEIATWFDNAMDRISGVYKRWTQLWNFLIALGLAILLNISTVHVATMLWKQPVNTKVIENNKGINETDALAAIQQLDSLALPIGWFQYHQPIKGSNQTSIRPDWSDAPEMVLGWLITAIAALFGAPFWFDLLQRVIRLKAAGPSPEEKKTNAAAAA